MFQFSSPEYLHLLWGVPVLVVVYTAVGVALRRRRAKMGDAALVGRLVEGRSRYRGTVKFVLTLLSVALCIVMLARPQYGIGKSTEKKSGIEAVIMMDVSNSMMANDVQPSRLERSKLLVRNLIDRMENDRVALGVFAGEAYPQMPITSDYASAKMFLDAISPSMVTLQGTNLAAAIELGMVSFTENRKAGKAIILITDGENHEGGEAEAAAKAAKEGMRIFVVGVGTPEGSAIPMEGGGVLTDNAAQPVRTALNEQLCRDVAAAGRGVYFHLDNTNRAQEELLSALDGLQKAESTSEYTTYDEQFQAVALLVLLLIIVELFMRETKNPFFARFKLFSKK